MRLNISIHIVVLVTALFISCSQTKVETPLLETKKSTTKLKYAKRFNIETRNKVHLVSIFGNRHTQETTAKFVVSDDTLGLKRIYPDATVIQSPCKKIVALSSIYANLFNELGDLENLVGIDNLDYIINKDILKKAENTGLRELAKTPKIDLEQTVNLAPDIIFTFGMGEGEKDIDRKLQQTGIPVAISIDHLEESPLARAEWIKFFAVFTGKLVKADSLFNATEENYLKLCELAKTEANKPTVFSEIKYSEFWYMPGGKSYVATLMNDAGANYLWKDNTNFGSLPLSFEQVYTKAKDADYWIHLSTLKTKKELEASESRYAYFKAFKTNQLYNNTLHTNDKGYSTYWETGMIYPDRILNDLIAIFHPKLKPQLKKDLYYYEQLK
jgi:iron complex transport system substrate-binding protein